MLGASNIAKILAKTSQDKEKSQLDMMAKKIIINYPEKVPAIIKALQRILEFEDSQVTVISARVLSQNEMDDIKKGVSSQFDYPLKFNFRVSNELGAGIIIRKGELVIDNSARCRIEQIANKIKLLEI